MPDSEPIVVTFVEIVYPNWPLIVLLASSAVAVVSLLASNEYLKRVPLARQRPSGPLHSLEREWILGAEPDPHSIKVGRIFRAVAAAGLVGVAASFAVMMLR